MIVEIKSGSRSNVGNKNSLVLPLLLETNIAHNKVVVSHCLYFTFF